MNRGEMIKELATRADCTQAQATAVLDAFGEVLIESAKKGEKVQLPGLLSLEVVDRAARTGRNPQTGEEIKIAASKAVKLTPGATLKNAAKK